LGYWQTLATQLWPEAQALPQAPQWLASDVVSTHAAMPPSGPDVQEVKPVAHTQAPLLQI
jgi:hypothetical protein